jgi:hypothetical protein
MYVSLHIYVCSFYSIMLTFVYPYIPFTMYPIFQVGVGITFCDTLFLI